MNRTPPSPHPSVPPNAPRRRLARAATLGPVLALATSLVLASCSSGDTDQVAEPGADPSPTAQSLAGDVGGNEREVASLTPRAVISHEGGLITIDTESGDVVDSVDHPGFLRLNNAGDGRHVMVSDSDVFRVYNAGIQAQAHGDHAHHYETTPGLTEVTFEAAEAGHVVLHDGHTTLFADGTGEIQTFRSADLADGSQPEVETASTDDPHHGVALRLRDDSMFLTQGTEDFRDTIQVVDAEGELIAETTDCPGSHGEAAAQPTATGDVVVMGCENGPVVYRDKEFHKVPVEDDYSRSGNLAGDENSPIVLGDYKVDADADQERPTRVALIDTHQDTLKLVDLDSSYWFRSLARGPEGEALVLTYDGDLTIIDQDSGEITAEIPVIGQWEEKEDWQEPGPILKAADDKAYVTDASSGELHVVDLGEQKVINTIKLPRIATEMAVVTGEEEAPADS